MVPRARRSSSSSVHIRSRCSGSSPTVGSSRIRSAGRCTVARAISASRRQPPESCRPSCDARSRSRVRSSASSTACRASRVPNPASRAANSRFSSTVSSPSMHGSWNTSPRLRRMADRSATRSWPNTRAVPRDGPSSVASSSMVVVLPGAVGTQQADQCAAGDGELKRIERASRTVVAPESRGLDRRR